jgi:peptidoglycan-N-acetylglucosamine deacetylase
MDCGRTVACWGSLALLLAMTSSTLHNVESPSDQSQSTPLRFAFIDSTLPEGRTALAKHIGDLDGVIGEWLDVDSDGQVSEEEDPDQDGADLSSTLKFIRSTRPLTVLALVSDTPGGSRAFANLGDPDFRSRLERRLLEAIDKFGFDGFLINFDDPRGADEAGLRQLIDELHAVLARSNKKVGVVLPGDWPVDYEGLSSVSDLAVVELFDEGQPNPAPLSPDSWWRRAIAARSKEIPSAKLVFAFGSKGRDWTLSDPDGFSEGISFAELMLIASSQGVQVEFDKTSGNPHFSYFDNGAQHDVWFLDAVTVFNQLLNIVPLRPKGVALWELGTEDESLWSLFKDLGSGAGFDPSAIEYMRCDYIAMRVGKGEVYRFKNRAQTGRRSMQFDEVGEIDDETYTTLPRPWEVQVSGVVPGSVVLTFDDGPNPEYTQKILDILKREGVKATFFVIGLQSIAHPSTIRRIVNEGHELGNHTFTHPDLTKLPDFLVRLEINATQRLLQVLTGKSVVLMRPPYAADDMGDSTEEAHVLELVTGMGYTAIGANLNPEDWRGTPAKDIIEHVVREAEAGKGSVIELHDAGGDRNPTVEALPALIETLRGMGFQFVQASQLARGATEPSDQIVGDPWLSVAKLGVDGMFVEDKLFKSLFWTCLVLSGFRFLLLLISALRGRAGRKPVPDSDLPVSVLIAAYNEENVIVRTIEGVLRSDYRHLAEVIVVDDGSTDGTAQAIQAAFHDDRRVRLVRTPNRGKAEALNRAVAEMQTEIAIMLDADTCVHGSAVRLLARHFSDRSIAAVAGNAKVGNRRNILTNLQALEYITSQNLERAGLAKLNAITVVPGAIGAWRREVLLKAGGFSPTTLAEDCDLTFSLHRLGYRIVHDMEAIAWTEAPESWRAFSRQRFRWTFGTLQAAYRHSDAMFSAKWDGFALVTLPSVILFSIALPLISPILDFFLLTAVVRGLVGVFMHPEAFDLQPTLWVVAAYCFVFLVDLLTAVLAFSFEPNEQKGLIRYLPIQRICYRQVMYVIIIRALLACLRGNAQGWNKLRRLGSVTYGAVPELPR